MSRVEINSGGHQVIVDHDSSDLTYVIDKARALWESTKPAPGPATSGFAITERQAPKIGFADMGAGRQPDVRA